MPAHGGPGEDFYLAPFYDLTERCDRQIFRTCNSSPKNHRSLTKNPVWANKQRQYATNRAYCRSLYKDTPRARDMKLRNYDQLIQLKFTARI